MSNEVVTEVEIQNHTKAVAGLATQLGYEGALTVGALEDEIRFSNNVLLKLLWSLANAY